MVSCRSALNVDPRDFSFLILCGVYHGVLGFSVISPSAAVIGGLGLREQKIGVTVHASEEGGPTPDGCGGDSGPARRGSLPLLRPSPLLSKMLDKSVTFDNLVRDPLVVLGSLALGLLSLLVALWPVRFSPGPSAGPVC